MDYEQMYTNALERAKDGKPIDEIFPELDESDDEKVMKWLMEMVEEVRKANPTNAEHNGMCSEAIAWLKKQGEHNMGISEATKQKLEDNLNKALEKETPESWNEFLGKQCEQKPVDEVEPKFKVGDWIICHDHEPVQILSIKSEMYYWSNGDIRPIEAIDSNPNIHLWNIKDAKPGDVLANKYGSVFIYAGFEEGRGTVNDYCFVTVSGDEFCVEDHKTGSWYYISDLKPATKEQRDFLFQKMHEAGYEWNAEKKELKKIEQTFSEYEKPLLERFKKAVYDCAWEKVTCKVEGESKEEYADRWAEQLLMLVRDWTDACIDSREDAIRRRSFDKGKYSMQNHTWSDEDEKIRKALIEYFQVDGCLCGNIPTKDVRAWLEKQDVQAIKEALRTEYEKGRADAIAEMQKPDWSEEDEKTYNRIYDLIHAAAYANYDVDEDGKELGEYAKIINWLKFIKERMKE